MHFRPPYRALLGLLALPFFACVPAGSMDGVNADGTGGATSGEGGGDGPTADPGTCDAWKIAFCGATTRCSFDTKEECETDVGYAMCRQDAPLGKCAEALEDSKCDELPKDCDPRDIADRTLPTAVCEDLQAAACELSLTCGYELSYEGCLANQAAAQPCGEFTAVLPGYEECLDAYRTVPCDGTLPESCRGLLRR